MDAPPRVEAVCWTPEAIEALNKPSWREALRHHVVIADDYGLLKYPP
jgi:hypothetical protein